MALRLLLPDARRNALATSEREFLSNAISGVGEGEDANLAFGVTAERGERKTRKERRMTKRNNGENGRLSFLHQRLCRLRYLALKLKAGDELGTNEREFLAVVLSRIGDGEDANLVLGVKAERGERRSPREAAKSDRFRFALSWIAAITTPEENEYFFRPGVSLRDAFARASKFFRVKEGTLRTHWYGHREFRSPSFDRPITSLP
jgi:hypothetical protein